MNENLLKFLRALNEAEEAEKSSPKQEQQWKDAEYEKARQTGTLNKPPAKIQKGFLDKIYGKNPFLWAIYARGTEWIKSSSCPTAGVRPVGGKIRFYYNENFLNSLTEPQIIFLMEHEVEHMTRRHRRRFKLASRFAGLTPSSDSNEKAFHHEVFNIAADSIINRDLIDKPLTGLGHEMIDGGIIFKRKKKKMFEMKPSKVIPNVPPNVSWDDILKDASPEVKEKIKELRYKELEYIEMKVDENDENGKVVSSTIKEIPVSSFEALFGNKKNELGMIEKEEDYNEKDDASDDLYLWGIARRENYEKNQEDDEDGDEGEDDGQGQGQSQGKGQGKGQSKGQSKGENGKNNKGEGEDWNPEIGMPIIHPDGTYGKITNIDSNGSVETEIISKEEADKLSDDKSKMSFSRKLGFKSASTIEDIIYNENPESWEFPSKLFFK